MVTVRRSFIAVLFICLIATSSAFGSATNIYITQSGSASGNCTTNVQTPAFFNTSSNWGSGASQIGPGTTVLICGTFTGTAGATEFTFQGSGVSGNPVILKFDTGAKLTAPYWSGSNGAIGCSKRNYVMIDGGTNGLITNTANGTNLANHQLSYGVTFTSCTYAEVKNLTINNIYINNGSSASATDTSGATTACIEFNGASTGSLIHNNNVSQCKTGVQVSADANADASNVQIYANNISDMDWGINAGGGDSGDTIYNLQIYANNITNWTNWQFPTGTLHQDGIILYNYATGSQTLTASIYNNYIHGDLGVGSPTGFIYCAQNASCAMFNNLLVNTGHTIDGIIWADTHLGGDKIYNNTIVGISSDIAITLGSTPATNVSTPMIVNNNLVLGPGCGLHDYQTLTADVSVSDHNVWRTASGAATQMATKDSTYITYATWLKDGFDANSTNADPKLDSTFHLQAGSSASGLGANLTDLNLSALDLDMALNPRPSDISVKWDAGVYNFSTSTVAAPTNLAAVVH
jgi:hypothetical protein